MEKLNVQHEKSCMKKNIICLRGTSSAPRWVEGNFFWQILQFQCFHLDLSPFSVKAIYLPSYNSAGKYTLLSYKSAASGWMVQISPKPAVSFYAGAGARADGLIRVITSHRDRRPTYIIKGVTCQREKRRGPGEISTICLGSKRHKKPIITLHQWTPELQRTT